MITKTNGLRGRSDSAESARVRLVVTAGIAYVGLIALTTWQALRGQPLTQPDGATLMAAGALVAVVAGITAVTALRRPAHVTK